MSDKPLVVLLHGLARRHTSMNRLATYLQKQGYETWAKTYPSRQLPIEESAKKVADWIADVAKSRPLFAVTHSMGGIIARHLHDPRLKWQRMVMLAPPNAGSKLARDLAQNRLFRWFYGPAGGDLAKAAQWPQPPAPFAVIAGTKHFAMTNLTSWTVGRRFMSGNQTRPNDGTVAVDETMLEGMTEFAEVNASHTWIMNDPQVHQFVLRFFATGRFGQ